MKKGRTAENRFVEEVGRANNGQTIFHIRIKVGAGRYKHYLDCPLRDAMLHIEGQTSEKIPSDVLDKEIQHFKTLLEKLLENKKGPH